MKVGDTKQFVVRSTAGIPSIEWVGSISPQLEMTRVLAGESMVVQITYKAAVEGLSQVTFQAAAKELKKQVTISLLPGSPPAAKKDEAKTGGTKNPTPKTPGPVGTTDAASKLGPQNVFEKGLGSDKVQALQAKLKVPQTGTFDAATRSAIQQWQVEKKKALRNGVLQSATFNEIMK